MILLHWNSFFKILFKKNVINYPFLNKK